MASRTACNPCAVLAPALPSAGSSAARVFIALCLAPLKPPVRDLVVPPVIAVHLFAECGAGPGATVSIHEAMPVHVSGLLRFCSNRDHLGSPAFLESHPSGSKRTDRASVVEYRPANVIAAGLVFEDKLPKCVGDLPTLPVPFGQTSQIFRPTGCRSLNRFDGIGCGAEIVFGNMGNAGSLACRIGGKAGCPLQGPGGAHGVSLARASISYLATRPSPSRFNRFMWPRIPAIQFLEQWQHMLGTSCRPQREKPMVCFGKRPTTADGHEAGITDCGKDHVATLFNRRLVPAIVEAFSNKPAVSKPRQRISVRGFFPSVKNWKLVAGHWTSRWTSGYASLKDPGEETNDFKIKVRDHRSKR